MSGGTPPRLRSALLGWWYLTIGAGFFLLGLNRLMLGEAWWGVGIRWLIAAGFLVLGGGELRYGPRRR